MKTFSIASVLLLASLSQCTSAEQSETEPVTSNLRGLQFGFGGSSAIASGDAFSSGGLFGGSSSSALSAANSFGGGLFGGSSANALSSANSISTGGLFGGGFSSANSLADASSFSTGGGLFGLGGSSANAFASSGASSLGGWGSGSSSSAQSFASASGLGGGSASAFGSASSGSGGLWGGSYASSNAYAQAGGYGFGGRRFNLLPLWGYSLPPTSHWSLLYQRPPLSFLDGAFFYRSQQNFLDNLDGIGHRTQCVNRRCVTISYDNGRVDRQYQWDDENGEYEQYYATDITVKPESEANGDVVINTRNGYMTLSLPYMEPAKTVEDNKGRPVPVVLQGVMFPEEGGPFDCLHWDTPEEFNGLPGTLNVGRDEKHRPLLGYKVQNFTTPGYHCVKHDDDSKQIAFADKGEGERFSVEHGSNKVVKSTE